MYQQGNIVFTPDGNSVLSPVGNRVSVFDLVKSVMVSGQSCARKSNQLTNPLHSNKSFTFAFQNRKNIAAIALSPHGNILISVDEGAAKNSSVFHHVRSSPRPHRRKSSARQLPPGCRRSPFQLQKASQRHRIFAQWIVHCCDTRFARPGLEDSQPPCPRVRAIQSTPNVYGTS